MRKRNIITALISLIIAFGLWAYVITVVNLESEVKLYNIPVVLEGETVLEERGLMLVSGKDSMVTLRLSGKRSDLYKLNSANVTLIADLTRIYEAGSKTLSYEITYPGDVPDNAISVLDRSPGLVQVEVAARAYKLVPVRVEYTGTVAQDYIALRGDMSLEVTDVRVNGPQAVIEQIENAVIQVDLTDRNESFSEAFRYTLCNADGDPVDAELVTTDIAEVRVGMTIQKRKKLPLVFSVEDGGGATSETSEITIDPEMIEVCANDLLLESLTQVNVGTIRLSELLEDKDVVFPVSLPDSVTNLSGISEATVHVRFPNLRTKEFSVTDITALNVPEGMAVEFVTKALKISVRGPIAVINRLSDADISATVDFSDAVEGTSSREAVIVIKPGFEEAGPVNSYNVSATLMVASEEPEETQ